jgi:hypothetical protein
MMQEYLVAWINWYYGENNLYPIDIFEKLSHAEKMETISKTDQIKKIVGRSR